MDAGGFDQGDDGEAGPQAEVAHRFPGEEGLQRDASRQAAIDLDPHQRPFLPDP